jgi:transposase
VGSKVKMLYLPPYSPNLNLIERLWRLLHKEVQENRYYETFELFKRACADFLDNLHLRKDQLRSLLAENFHIVNPAQT